MAEFFMFLAQQKLPSVSWKIIKVIVLIDERSMTNEELSKGIGVIASGFYLNILNIINTLSINIHIEYYK